MTATLIKIYKNILKLNIPMKSKYYLIKVFTKLYFLNKKADKLRRETEKILKKFPKQYDLIHSNNWDILIILDACRYDKFAIVTKHFFDTSPTCVASNSSETLSWLNNNFSKKKFDDVAYISATPFVNSKGLNLGFKARDKFGEIIDVWDWGFSRKYFTVPPDKVSLAFRTYYLKRSLRGDILGKDYRIILHYIQPHAPYRKSDNLIKIVLKRLKYYSSSSEKTPLMKNEALQLALKSKIPLDYLLVAEIANIYGFNKVKEIITDYYVDNIFWALRSIEKIFSWLKKKNQKAKIVLTADHGELLGEYGIYFHPNLPLLELRKIPWLEVVI